MTFDAMMTWVKATLISNHGVFSFLVYVVTYEGWACGLECELTAFHLSCSDWFSSRDRGIVRALLLNSGKECLRLDGSK